MSSAYAPTVVSSSPTAPAASPSPSGYVTNSGSYAAPTALPLPHAVRTDAPPKQNAPPVSAYRPPAMSNGYSLPAASQSPYPAPAYSAAYPYAAPPGAYAAPFAASQSPYAPQPLVTASPYAGAPDVHRAPVPGQSSSSPVEGDVQNRAPPPGLYPPPGQYPPSSGAAASVTPAADNGAGEEAARTEQRKRRFQEFKEPKAPVAQVLCSQIAQDRICKRIGSWQGIGSERD